MLGSLTLCTPTIDIEGYNVANQLVNDGTNTLTYDDNGNLTSDGVSSYTWDRANRLLSMGGVSNQYDGAGHRIQKTVGVDVTKYLLDLQPGLSVALSANKNGDITRFVHTPVGIHAQEDPNGIWTWAAQDGLGSVRLEANNALSVLGMRHLDPFGNPFGAQGTMTLPFVFTGEIRDENGLQDHRARQYSSQLGIFPSLDPFEGTMQRPMSLNGYSWVEGNTPNAVDPSGRFGILAAIGMVSGSRDVAAVLSSGTCLIEDNNPCSQYYWENGQRYAMCQDDNRLNQCPPGWTLYENCDGRACWPGRILCIRENTGSSQEVRGAGDIWNEFWRTTACNLLIAERERLKTTNLPGCERLAQLVEYAATLGYQNTRTMVDDISCALTDARGPNTIIDATTRFTSELALGPGGWDPTYEDGTVNQAFHFWSYLNTVAQSYDLTAGVVVGSLANYLHECWAVAPSPNYFGGQIPLPGVDIYESTPEDVRLALAGMAFGIAIYKGDINPSELADEIRNILCIGAAPFPLSDSYLHSHGLYGGISCPFSD